MSDEKQAKPPRPPTKPPLPAKASVAPKPPTAPPKPPVPVPKSKTPEPAPAEKVIVEEPIELEPDPASTPVLPPPEAAPTSEPRVETPTVPPAAETDPRESALSLSPPTVQARKPRWLGPAIAALIAGAGLVAAVIAWLVAGRAPEIAAQAPPRPVASAAPSATPTASVIASAEPAVVASAPEPPPSASAAPVLVASASVVAAPVVEAGPPTKRAKRFDYEGALAALAAVNPTLDECKKTEGGPRGPGSVRVNWDNEGVVYQATIGWPYDKTAEGDCILEKFKAIRLRPYEGPPSALNHVFNLRN